MKECPKCHKTYNDDVKFCYDDGSILVMKPVDVGSNTGGASSTQSISSSVNNNSGQMPVKKTGSGCLKKIIVTVVVCAISLGLLYHYVMNAATYLRIEPEGIEVAKCGGTTKIDIDYDGYVWTVNHKPEWVEVEEDDENNKIAVTISPNTDGQEREGSITIQSGKCLAQLIIKQRAVATRMTLSTSEISFGESGGDDNITVKTDGCKQSIEAPEWITATQDEDGNITVKCSGNDGEYRTGSVTVSEDNVSSSISVMQSGTCNVCHGEGKISCSMCNGMGSVGFGMFSSPCGWCHGQGSSQCNTCGGSGHRD